LKKFDQFYKTGDKQSLQNYRSTSVLSSFSKIYEKIIFKRLLKYLEINNILSNSQYGFRKNHSICMSLIDMYDKIGSATDRCEFSIGIFVDLSKTFDTLDHGILLKKLEYYGIRGIALQCFKSYLGNAKQCVELNGARSEHKHISIGVPQGLILVPLLFILYMNDIANASDLLMFILFADDTNIFYSCKNLIDLEETVNNELKKVSNWFRANNYRSMQIKPILLYLAI